MRDEAALHSRWSAQALLRWQINYERVQQFFVPSSNARTDEYGGSIENRARFAIEVAKAVVEEIGADRTAIRLSLGTNLWGIEEGKEGPALYRHLVSQLNDQGLNYLHVMHQGDEELLADIRALWSRTIILNRPGRPREAVGSDVEAGLADLEAYAQMVLANPDFVARLNADAPLNEAGRIIFFDGDDKVYTEYPTLQS